MTFGSLFAGIGGFDLGFERAGHSCLWQVEINEFCANVLARHWPAVPRHSDIRDFHPGDSQYCDIICGGFPCKQTSTAAAVHGRRNGLDGADSGLWYEMLRVVRLVRSSWVVIENVGGASSWSDQIKSGLEAAGYSVPREPWCLSAQASGAPHLRRRLFWTAHRDEQGLEVSWGLGPSETGVKSRGTAHGNSWLPTLAGVLRVDDGVPGRVDRRERITAIGNALMPCMAEKIGRWISIKEKEICSAQVQPLLRPLPVPEHGSAELHGLDD